MAETFTVYDVNIDETRPLTQADLDMFKNVYSAFGMRSEAEKALAALTLAVGQGKVSSADAWPLLNPLIEWARKASRAS